MSNLTFTNTVNVAIDTFNLGAAQERGVQSGTFTARLWNRLDAAAPVTSMATALSIYPTWQMNPGDPFVGDCEPSLNMWLWGRLNGNIVNPLAGVTTDHATRTTQFVPFGGRARWFWPNLPDRFAREFELFILPMGSGPVGGSASALGVNAFKLGWTADIGQVLLDSLSKEREGNAAYLDASDTKHALIGGPYLIGGAECTTGLTTINHVMVDHAAYMLGGIALVLDRTELGPISNNDVNGAALAAGERYDAIIVKDATGTGYTIAKGVKAVAGNQVPPVSPSADAVPLYYVTRRADADLGGLVNFVDLRIHESFVTSDGTGLDAMIGGHVNSQAGGASWDTGNVPVAVPAAAGTKRFYINAQGNVGVQNGVVTAGQNLWAKLDSDGANVTKASQRGVRRAPSYYRGTLDREVRTWDGQRPNSDGEIWLFGFLSQVASGTVSTTPSTVTVSGLTGSRMAFRVTGLTDAGKLRATGTRVATGSHGGGSELEEVALVAEDFWVTKAQDWFVTSGRWLSSNLSANSPDVVLSAVAGPPNLNCTVDAYACDWWEHNGKPFQLASLDLSFELMSDDAQLRARLWKVRSAAQTTGLTTELELLWDTGVKAGWRGNAAASANDPGTLHRLGRLFVNETSAAVSCDTGEPDGPPDAAVVWPRPFGPREAVICQLSDLRDIGLLTGILNFYNLLVV